MKDFSRVARENIPFTIDGDTFYAIPEVGGGVIEDLAAVVGAKDDASKMRAIGDFLDQALEEPSAILFAERFRSKENPISFTQALEIFNWLVEVYTNNVRPTQAPSNSHTGPGSEEASSPRRQPSAGSTRRVAVLPTS